MPLNQADALVEIERAVRNAFPTASHVAAPSDTSDVLVKFVDGEKSVSIRFNQETLSAYAGCDNAFRENALKTLRLVCNFAFAREYAANDDPVNRSSSTAKWRYRIRALSVP